MTKGEMKILERDPNARAFMQRLARGDDQQKFNARALSLNGSYSIQDACAAAGWIIQGTDGIARWIMITSAGKAKFR
jgi:hypothetical protein